MFLMGRNRHNLQVRQKSCKQFLVLHHQQLQVILFSPQLEQLTQPLKLVGLVVIKELLEHVIRLLVLA